MWKTSEHLVFRYNIEQRAYYDAASGEIAFAVVWKGSQENNRRPFVACPLCGTHVDVLVHVGEWHYGGAGRHGLMHRSAFLSKEVRWSEKLQALDGEIAVAEASGARGKVHEQRLAKREALLALLNHRRVSANVLQLARVTTEWVEPVAIAP